MGLDKTLEFSDKQVITSTAVSTVVHENSKASKDVWGTAKNNQIGGMSFNVTVTTAMTNTGTAVITLATKTADATLSSGATTKATINLAAGSVAGTKHSVILPAGTERLKHLGGLITVSGTIGAGNINCWLGLKQELID